MAADEEGPFFEDFAVGAKFQSRVGRTITETDNIWFTLLTGNQNPIHFDAAYAKTNFPGEPFRGRLVVNGFLTIAIAAGLLVDATSRNGFQVGIGNVTFEEPVFHGDTIYSDAEVTAVRESKSRPGFGLVTLRTRGRNERGQTVVEFDRSVMVRKRGVRWDGRRAH